MRPAKIISGGQTGADRAGLDVAIHLGIPWGGYAPRGWLSEDRGNQIPHAYRRATLAHHGYQNGLVVPDGDQGIHGVRPAEVYRERTELNVRDCDAALLFYGDKYTPGTQLTEKLCRELHKPIFVWTAFSWFQEIEKVNYGWSISRVKQLIDAGSCTLLVAGTRESKAPGIYAYVYTILREALR